jgi:IS1 family transposase
MHLLDINVWLAMAFRRHVNHAAAVAWFQAAPGPCFFCRLTQMGFLRLASSRSAMGPAAVSMADAWRAYDALFSDPKVAAKILDRAIERLSDGFSPGHILPVVDGEDLVQPLLLEGVPCGRLGAGTPLAPHRACRGGAKVRNQTGHRSRLSPPPRLPRWSEGSSSEMPSHAPRSHRGGGGFLCVRLV